MESEVRALKSAVAARERDVCRFFDTIRKRDFVKIKAEKQILNSLDPMYLEPSFGKQVRDARWTAEALDIILKKIRSERVLDGCISRSRTFLSEREGFYGNFVCVMDSSLKCVRAFARDNLCSDGFIDFSHERPKMLGCLTVQYFLQASLQVDQLYRGLRSFVSVDESKGTQDEQLFHNKLIATNLLVRELEEVERSVEGQKRLNKLCSEETMCVRAELEACHGETNEQDVATVLAATETRFVTLNDKTRDFEARLRKYESETHSSFLHSEKCRMTLSELNRRVLELKSTAAKHGVATENDITAKKNKCELFDALLECRKAELLNDALLCKIAIASETTSWIVRTYIFFVEQLHEVTTQTKLRMCAESVLLAEIKKKNDELATYKVVLTRCLAEIRTSQDAIMEIENEARKTKNELNYLQNLAPSN